MQMDAERSGKQPKPSPSVYAKTYKPPCIQIFMLYINIRLFWYMELFLTLQDPLYKAQTIR